MKAKRAPKRDLFAELSEGMTALAEARQGKRTLRTHTMEFKPAPEISAREVVRVRQHLRRPLKRLLPWQRRPGLLPSGCRPAFAEAGLLSLAAAPGGFSPRVAQVELRDRLPGFPNFDRIVQTLQIALP